MQQNQYLSFDVYRLDVPNECVWRGKQMLRLTPKAFAVLRYLLAHAGRLVTKEELFQAVWPDIAVSDAALTICISEIRKVLGETAQAPRFIATVHRRGYRFLAPVTEADPAATAPPPPTPPLLLPVTLPPRLVGREAELMRLRGWLAQAQAGTRQVVFVSGEAGIGKTTVVDALLASVAPAGPCWVGRGQCLEHHGAGEAYLPVLDALGRLCRGAGKERFQVLLRQYAPTWVLQMPTLLSVAEREAVQRQAMGASRERMLRELAEAVEAITAEQPLVLLLEDLHWSDHATLDLVAWLAQRREPAWLLLLGTYRPVEAMVQGHPLRAVTQALTLRGQGRELRLEGLSEAAVGAYLAARLPAYEAPPGLIRLLHQHTDGQPLFLVQVVEAWVQQGWVQEVDGQWSVPVGIEELAATIPENVRQLIEQEFDGLRAEEQRWLEAASVVGVEFSAAAVAAEVEEGLEPVEEGCEALARRGQFLRGRDVEAWPDGTVAGRYGFRHALYQQVVYNRLPIGRRLRLHRRIGERLEAGYGARAGEQAAVLAMHFASGRDVPRAVRYLQQAAENAAQRHAHHEVVALATKGVELLGILPESPARLQQELDLQVALGPALLATKGYADPDVGRAYARARELCQQIGDTQQLFPVLRGLLVYYQARGQLQTAVQLGEQLLCLAQSQPEPALLMLAHHMLGQVFFFRGRPVLAHTHHTQALALYNPQAHRVLALRYGVDLGAGSHDYLARELWLLGYPDQALQHSQAALTLAQEVSHPYSLAFALTFSALLHQFCREASAAYEQAAAATTLATEQGFALWATYGTVLHGWARAMQGQSEAGIAEIRQGLAAALATGAKVMQPYFLGLLAEAYGEGGHPEAGLPLLAEAMAVMDTTEVRFYGAEISRLKGTLLLKQAIPEVSQAEACFQQALTIARRQQAKSWELRAAMSLSRLWQQQGKRAEAYELLAPLYGWFTEGFDTMDLQEAQALLTALR
jgi:predicted ATPase/DNA-binding winged helix-turn-helix (wHTH) protein